MSSVTEDVRNVLANEESLRYEEEISRNPYLLDSWLKYLEFKKDGKPSERHFIHERALKCLPRSYKLWRQYLQERGAQLAGKSIADKRYRILVNTYERALVHLHKMPRIWLDYCAVLAKLKRGTLTRRTFDRALQALPITQHDRVWNLYLEWVRDFGVKDTAIRVYRRYLQYDPQHREEFVDYLESAGSVEEAAQQLAVCVNDDDFVSPGGHSKHQLWMRLCDMCAKHPKEVSGSLKVDAIIRSGLARFTDEVGRLWCKLADYYIRMGQFERARDIYEEGINSVTTVRDFTAIFDAYAQFEESVISAKMQQEEEEDDEEEEDEEEEDMDVEGNDMDLRLARLEHLMERRPILLSSVLLRQNPHNVAEWHKRVKLYKDANDARNVIQTYAEAVKTVDPEYATGKPHTLWLSFAEFYETHGDIDSSRQILEKACAVEYKTVDDLASVFCSWGEMELRQAEVATEEGDPDGAAEAYQSALTVMQRATAEPSLAVRRKRMMEASGSGKGDAMVEGVPCAERVHKSVKVWTFYLDLEESLGTIETAKAAYDRVLELRIATPQIVLNYSTFLEENKYFEESFTVFEKGIATFNWPHVKPLWHRYLDQFIARYGGSKLERARDLFEQAVSKCPADCAAELYLKYAKLEEEHGLVRHAMGVYDRATRAVTEKQKLDMYMLYIKKAESYYGVTRTREIHEVAIKSLPDKEAQQMSLTYATMEKKLGEVDRARAIFSHGGQFTNPRREPKYWKEWHDFEVAHGNEDTFRDMLRIKRSVQTAFAQETFHDMGNSEAPVQSDAEALAKQAERDARLGITPAGDDPGTAGVGVNAAGVKRKAAEGGAAETDMEALERQAAKIMAATKQAELDAATNGAAEENPEEIDLDEEFDLDDEPEAEVGNVQQKAVPAGVFGETLAKSREEAMAREAEEKANGGGEEEEDRLGALERMKREAEKEEKAKKHTGWR